MRSFHVTWSGRLALCVHIWSPTSRGCSVPLLNKKALEFPVLAIEWAALHLCNHHNQQHLNIYCSWDNNTSQKPFTKPREETSARCSSRAWIQFQRDWDLFLTLFERFQKTGDWSGRNTCACSLMTDWRTAMTGKLADKIPITMSSLINTIPDSLYPEEDIPTSMNIFTNPDSISHYSQMNTGKGKKFWITSPQWAVLGVRNLLCWLVRVHPSGISCVEARWTRAARPRSTC